MVLYDSHKKMRDLYDSQNSVIKIILLITKSLIIIQKYFLSNLYIMFLSLYYFKNDLYVKIT